MDIEEFYSADERRRQSAEVEFGTNWFDAKGSRYELSWVEDTGELYVMLELVPEVDSWTPFGDSEVEEMPADRVLVMVVGYIPTLERGGAACWPAGPIRWPSPTASPGWPSDCRTTGVRGAPLRPEASVGRASGRSRSPAGRRLYGPGRHRADMGVRVAMELVVDLSTGAVDLRDGDEHGAVLRPGPPAGAGRRRRTTGPSAPWPPPSVSTTPAPSSRTATSLVPAAARRAAGRRGCRPREAVALGADWEAGFAAMLEHAATTGWIAEDGSIRAHVEWRD